MYIWCHPGIHWSVSSKKCVYWCATLHHTCLNSYVYILRYGNWHVVCLYHCWSKPLAWLNYGMDHSTFCHVKVSSHDQLIGLIMHLGSSADLRYHFALVHVLNFALLCYGTMNLEINKYFCAGWCWKLGFESWFIWY